LNTNFFITILLVVGDGSNETVLEHVFLHKTSLNEELNDHSDIWENGNDFLPVIPYRMLLYALYKKSSSSNASVTGGTVRKPADER